MSCSTPPSMSPEQVDELMRQLSPWYDLKTDIIRKAPVELFVWPNGFVDQKVVFNPEARALYAKADEMIEAIQEEYFDAVSKGSVGQPGWKEEARRGGSGV